MSCICHFPSTKDSEFYPLTELTHDQLKQAVTQWANLNKEPEKTICEGIEVELTPSSLIHKSCYIRLTSKAKLQQAKHSYERVSTPLWDCCIRKPLWQGYGRQLYAANWLGCPKIHAHYNYHTRVGHHWPLCLTNELIGLTKDLFLCRHTGYSRCPWFPSF